MSSHEYINCPSCDETYKIPRTDQQLKITCKYCQKVFYNFNTDIAPVKQKNKFLIPGIVIVILATIIWFNQDTSAKPGKSLFSRVKSSNWVTIDYSGLASTSTITHSGETVGQIIRKIPNYTDELKGQVQQYLEPYSILCHDVLLTSIQPDTLPLVNILTHYPVGSEQPAWVDLFREGHYQLYYNNQLIRVFIKGSNAKSSFDRYQSIIRHPIQDVIKSKNTSIENLEVYVFKNDYAKTEIKLNTIPKVFHVNKLDLSPKRKSIDLTSIEDFLSKGVILEAVEVDENNDLYFYGVNAVRQTMAGYPVSLSDMAVIYRSIFHYGNNAPYISLDKHEDNRYAKVNFGGHFENTRAGSVVLEADKLFKALGTGLDPNTHNLIKTKITKKVPDFLTEDERSLLEEMGVGQTQIRYWFYPDSIGTVTDGSIGAILTHQFLADVERMDIKASPSNAVKKTINHLNQYYSQYERAEKTFQELGTVGRIMSLVNWLKGMNMDDRIELDEFLSVKIPAFETPKKTKKMLAITVAAYPSSPFNISVAGFGNLSLNNQNVRKYTKVYYISDLLDKYSPTTSDKYFLEVAGDYFSQIDITEIAPAEYIELKNSLESIEWQIGQKKRTLNSYSSTDINNYNKLIDQQNILVKKFNNMRLESRCITSIGGGINLRPSEFKRISRNRNSPKLRELTRIKSKIKTVGKIAKSGKWIRSNPSTGKTRINTIPANQWLSSKSINGEIKYSHKSSSGNITSLTTQNSGNWTITTNISGSRDVINYDKSYDQLFVSHPGFTTEYRGTLSQGGKRVAFYK